MTQKRLRATQLKLLSENIDSTCCYHNFVIDTYPTCTFGCTYCYSQQVIIQSDPFSISDFIQDFTGPLWTALITKKVPLRIGHLTDPFPLHETTNHNTLDLIHFLTEQKYPFILITKSQLVATEEYVRVLRKGFGHVQISLSTVDDSISSATEPYASTPSERIAAIKILQQNNIHTSARLNLPNNQHILSRTYLKELITQIQPTGCKHYIINPIVEFHPSILNTIDYNYLVETFKDQVQISYCYLGSPLKNFYQFKSDSADCCKSSSLLQCSHSKEISFIQLLSISNRKFSFCTHFIILAFLKKLIKKVIS